MATRKKTQTKKPAAKKTVKVTVVKKSACTHIDRSNGVLLRKQDLDKKKPWISPISGQATVEELTQEEREAMKEA